MVKFKPCEDCECLFCFKSFECGTGCKNLMRCTVDDTPEGFIRHKSDKWDYRANKIIKATRIIDPEYLKENRIYNLLLRKDHIQIDGMSAKKDRTSLLNSELNYLAKRFDEMFKIGQTKINWRKL
jgi:hypothetical protein